MKKVLSLVLVIAMVLSSMSFAFAGTFEDVTGDYEDAVNALSALGVVNGYEDGTFRPERTISRAELAKVLVEALGYGKLVAGAANSFSDTQGHWASGYASIAAGTGLVIGYPNGTFQPDKTVTYDEAYTMVLRALGYADVALKGTWPTNYKIKAIDLGLDDDVVMATAAADRGGVAQILFNALEMNIMELGEENVLVDSGRDLLDNRADYEPKYEVDEDTLDPDHRDYGGNVIDLAPYMYQSLKVYLNSAKDVVYVKGTNNLVIEAEVVELEGDVLTVEYNDKDYDFNLNGEDITTEIFFNGEEADDFASVVAELEVKVVLDAEEDEKVASNLDVLGLVAKDATVTGKVADAYDDETVVLELEDDYVLPLVDVDDEDDGIDFDKLTVTGDVTSLEDIEKDDVVALYYGKNVENAANKLEIVVTRNVVEGKITRVNSDGDVTVGGKVYEDGAYEVIEDGVLVAGKSVTLYLDQNGDIYFAEVTEDAALDDYALVLETKTGFETDGGVRLAEPKVKVLTAAGEEVTYVLDDEEDEVEAFIIVDGNNLEVDLAEGDLIKYSLNKDVEVDDIELVVEAAELGEEDIVEIKTSGNSFNIASNAVIFNVPNGAVDTEDAAVVDVADLNDTVLAYRVYNEEETKIEVLMVYEELIESDTVYAVLARVAETVVDPDDEDEVVLEYTMFVDGEEVVYLGEVDVDAPVVTVTGLVVELVIEDGRLVGFNDVKTDHDDDLDVTGELEAQDERVTTSIKVEGGNPVYLTDDVIVYVYDADEVTIGSKSDIRDKFFVAYNFSYDVTDDYEVIVVNPVIVE